MNAPHHSAYTSMTFRSLLPLLTTAFHASASSISTGFSGSVPFAAIGGVGVDRGPRGARGA